MFKIKRISLVKVVLTKGGSILLLQKRKSKKYMASSKKARKLTINKSLETLLQRSEALRNGVKFKELLDFAAKFRQYKPFNNVLVYIQNPECTFYATEKHFKDKLDRTLKETARPMIILAPMHPVLFVYDVKDTEGAPLPSLLTETEKIFKVTGKMTDKWLLNLKSHFKAMKISLRETKMFKNHAGKIERTDYGKILITINTEYGTAVKLSTLIHELAHLMLGHLGSKDDEKFPERPGKLLLKTREIEAESVAYLVLQRLGLENNAYTYLAFHDAKRSDLEHISIDLIAKVSGKIESMIKKSVKK